MLLRARDRSQKQKEANQRNDFWKNIFRFYKYWLKYLFVWEVLCYVLLYKYFVVINL
jgi:hypothetical protein